MAAMTTLCSKITAVRHRCGDSVPSLAGAAQFEHDDDVPVAVKILLLLHLFHLLSPSPAHTAADTERHSLRQKQLL